MKTSLFANCIIICILSVICACTKTGEQIEESPFYTYFQIADIVIDTTKVPTADWEYGFVFTPLKKGKITKLGVRLPVTGDYTAKLWNLRTKTVLTTQTINLAIEHGSAFKDFAAIPVGKGDSLGISVQSSNFYRIQQKNTADFKFPQDLNNIRILSFNEQKSPGVGSGFPETQNLSRVAACVNTVFIADDE